MGRQRVHLPAMSRFWSLCSAAFRFLGDEVYAAPLTYPEGVKPGDQISGNAGEFWRYKHVLIKPPDDEDRMDALKMSEDVKCVTCETILHRLMKQVESNSEDHIMDALDGEPAEEPVETGDAQEDRVNKNRRGCNKHFKDEVLLRGYLVRQCPAVTVTVGSDEDNANKDPPKPKAWCLENVGSGEVKSRDVETYSTRSEAVFYACENTIARYGHEIARFLADKLDGGGELAGTIKDACFEAARCDGAAAGKTQKRRRKASGEKQIKNKMQKAADEDASMWDIMNEQKELEKKNKKRRRKSSKRAEL